MTDPDTGPAGRQPDADGTRASRPRPRTSAPTCGARSSPSALGIIDHDEAVDRLDTTLDSLETMERHEPSGQYYNWYDHTTRREADASGRRPATPLHADPVVGRQRLAGDRAARRRERRARGLPSGPQALFDSMDFGFYYRPSVNRIAFHYAPEHGRRRRAATTRSSARAGSRATSGSPRASCRRRSTSARGGPSPTPATGAGRRRSRSASTGPTSASTCSRAPTRTTDFRVVPGLGRQHVRGADAGAVRARGGVGRRAAGRSTTR